MERIGRSYLGMDIRRKDTTLTSFHVSQGSYVGELLKLLKGYPTQASSRPSQVPATKPSPEDLDEEAGARARRPGPRPGQASTAHGRRTALACDSHATGYWLRHGPRLCNSFEVCYGCNKAWKDGDEVLGGYTYMGVDLQWSG